MATLRITNFGGEVPSASDRVVPAESARVARNLLSRVSEYRPLSCPNKTPAQLSFSTSH